MTDIPALCPSLRPDEVFQQAIAQHQAGSLQEAEHLYRAILQTQPSHPDANHNLGVLMVQTGQPSAGLPHFEAALGGNPNQEQYWLSYLDALMQAGLTDAARQVLVLVRQRGVRGEVLEAFAQRLAEGAQATEQSKTEHQHAAGGSQSVSVEVPQNKKSKTKAAKLASRKKKDPSAQEINTLGTLFTEGRYAEAEVLARTMTTSYPSHGYAWKVLGAIFNQMGRSAEALVSLQKAVALSPDDPGAHSNLSATFLVLGRLAEAEACCRRALKIKPNYTVAHSNLGAILRKMERLTEAEACCRQALRTQPNDPQALSNLGAIIHILGRSDEAEAYCRRALEIKPDFAEALANLGAIFHKTGRPDEAEACCRRALKIKPDFVELHSSLIFFLDMADKVDMSELLRERKKWDEAHAVPLWREPVFTNDRNPIRRLRIGYVSGDLKNHSAAKVFGVMLTHYDRSQFEVFAYSNYRGQDDEVTELFRQNVTTWHNIVSLSDEVVAEMIRKDQIDILVDLSGHSEGNRLLVFARRPAPIQITAWGYASGTGMRAMDVLFTDPVVVPPQEKQYYTEELRYLPCIMGYFPPDPLPDVNELPALQDGIITFGSLNRLGKITAETYRAWTEVLLAIPRSRLILKTPELDNASVREWVVGQFTKAGVAADRISLQGKTSWHEHVKAFNQIDIGLDPFPHGGGVTALEGLMMGVPVITLRWPTMAGRVSASIMTTVGLTDWIAETREEYVELAIKKTRELQSIAELRQRLRSIFMSSALGDQTAYVSAAEYEYRQLWQEWCGGATLKS